MKRAVLSLCCVIAVACGTAPASTEALAPPALVVTPDVLFFEADGQATVTLRNDGEVPLGIESVTVQGAAFALDSVDCTQWGVGVGTCRIEPGQEASVIVSSTADEADAPPLWAGNLVIQTAGDEIDVFADRRQDRATVALQRTECGAPDLTVLPQVLDLGTAHASSLATGRVTLWNRSESESLQITEVREVEGCADIGVSLDSGGSSLGLTRMQAAVLHVDAGPSEAPITCSLEVQTESVCTGGAPSTWPVTIQANHPVEDAPFGVVVESPKNGTRVDGDVELRIRFENAFPSWCKVHSIRQGRADGSPAIADCATTEGVDTVTVTIPADFYVGTGGEVLEVRAMLDDGTTRTASVALRIGADAAPDDLDGDGFGTEIGELLDCDDTRVDVFPYGNEVANGLDDDCDRGIDEGTEVADDDGDGLTEVEGDCDDEDAAVYPGAPEARDGRDNDCDGLIDEASLAYDDDGDGFTELERDCDDDDATVSPDAVEICGNGIDDDCDQIPDASDPQGCVDLEREPLWIGEIRGPTAVEFGEEAEFRVLVGDVDDPDRPSAVTWQVSSGTILETPGEREATLRWRAPDGADLQQGTDEVLITADAGGGVSLQTAVRLSTDGSLDAPLVRVLDQPQTGCATTPVGGAVGLLGLFSLLLVRRRPRS